ncbi:hypothetical protein J2X46_003696 [Nocardioides sp. BE266]|uniref:hypothetical protein n=1 Tax=Nocardioides sp. BE266 TaxID=2817725 RepID=UPI0028645418|nr:hypothetical protein [Nocardioides sp. BE266]MDR7254698.1 hypothetical protein [Nocardioides sp. BE266]
MQLHAGVALPPDVVREALNVVPELVASRAPAPPEPPAQGLLSRLLGRRPAEVPVEVHAPVVSLPPAPPPVFIRMAKFGNVTADDAAALASAYEAAAATWSVPVLRVSRIRVTEEAPYDVMVELEGDVGALKDIYRNVYEVAQEQRFFLDRRGFRSEVSLGPVADVEDPASIAGAEVAHLGRLWSPSHLTLLRLSYNAGANFSEYASIELGDAAQEMGARTLA